MPLSTKGEHSQRQGCSSPAIQLTVLLPCATTESIQISKMSKASAVSWCVVVSRSVGVEAQVRNVHVPASPPYAFRHSIPRQLRFRNKQPISRARLLALQQVSARRHCDKYIFIRKRAFRGTGVFIFCGERARLFTSTLPLPAPLSRPLQISLSGFSWAVRLSAGTCAPIAVGRCSKFP
jgi:hypothetical protein